MPAIVQLECDHIIKIQHFDWDPEYGAKEYCKFCGFTPIRRQWVYMWHVTCLRCGWHVKGLRGGRKRFVELAARHQWDTGHQVKPRWYSECPTDILREFDRQVADMMAAEQQQIDMDPPF